MVTEVRTWGTQSPAWCIAPLDKKRVAFRSAFGFDYAGESPEDEIKAMDQFVQKCDSDQLEELGVYLEE